MASDATAPLDQYLKPIKDHVKLICAVAAAVTLLGVLASATVPTSYQATASVLVTPISTDPSETFESDVVVDMPTEERIATSKTVVALVSQRLAERSIDVGHDALAINVTVSSPEDSRILDLSYLAATPTLAQTGADTFAQAYLDYRSQLADENKSATEEALRERITLLKDQLAGVESELTGYQEGSSSYVTLSVERESIKSELSAQQDTLARLSTLSTDVGRIISPAELPDTPRGLGPFVMVLGALVAGVVLGCLAAYVLATIKSADAPRNRRATDTSTHDHPSAPGTVEASGPQATHEAAEPPQTQAPTATVDPPPAQAQPSPAPLRAETGEHRPAGSLPNLAYDLEPEPAPFPSPTEPERPAPLTELPLEPTRPEPAPPRSAGGKGTAVAQQQAMDAFFGPEPALSDKPPSLDVSADDQPTVNGDDDAEPQVQSTWEAGFLDPPADQSVDNRSAHFEPTDFPSSTDPSGDPRYFDPSVDDIGSNGDSLEAVAAEISTALPSLLAGGFASQPPADGADVVGTHTDPGHVSPDFDPIPRSASADSTSTPSPGETWHHERDRPGSGWQIDADVEQEDKSDIESAAVSEFRDDRSGPVGRTKAVHGARSTVPPLPPPPPPPPPPPAPLRVSEADFDPLLQRLGKLGQGHSVTCVCLGEAGRDASLATGFGLADQLQSRGVDVLVVDMLLEEPALNRLLGLSARPGMLDVLAEQATLDEGARGIPGLGSLRALTVGHEDDLADRRRTNDLINGWSMKRLLDNVGRTFQATVIIGGTVQDARRLNLVLKQSDGVVVGTEQMVGEPAEPELDAHLKALPTEVLALISIDAALSASHAAASGAPSM